MEELKNRLKKIELLALDVDGVLTDGTINIGAEGELFKAFHAQDGMGISCANRAGLKIAVITGRRSAIIHNRCEELKVELLREGVKDKRLELVTMAQELGLDTERIAFMGDDLNDLPAFSVSSVSFAPNDAVIDVQERADVVCQHRGGHGAVREAIELILRAQKKWQAIINAYLEEGQGDRQ